MTQVEEQDVQQQQQEIVLPKRFSTNIEKGINDFYRSTRLSEFLGGPGKRYSSYLVRSQGSPGYMLAKKLSEFLGGPGKKRPRGGSDGYFNWFTGQSSKTGFPEGSEFLGGPGR